MKRILNPRTSTPSTIRFNAPTIVAEGGYSAYVTCGTGGGKEETRRKDLPECEFFFGFWVRIFNAPTIVTEGAYSAYVTCGTDGGKEETRRKDLPKCEFFFGFWVRFFNAPTIVAEGGYSAYVTCGTGGGKEENTTQKQKKIWTSPKSKDYCA
ncbi:MAG: hypothetical protein IJ348_07810 [Alistipes sp.]|nr:hypothetical protein [Alistipes sp.]MBQ7856998.1 hypothetical protein [Alistipes sp.]